MRALVKAHAEPGIWMQDVPEPACGPNDVIVRVRRTAICGTDLHIYKWDDWARATIPVPMTVGHEFMGEVTELGSEVAGYAVGDRVSAEGHVTCGHCRRCRAGARHLCRNTVGIGVNRTGCFAEYVAVPAKNLYKLPDAVTDDLGAILDPFGNAVHTALTFELIGEDVLITGAGPIGAMACAVARHAGARNVVITDVNDYRLALAETMGATRTINVTREKVADVMPTLGMTEGFDVGLEMSGVPAGFADMLDAMNHGGGVAMLGLMPDGAGIDWSKVIFRGLQLHGIYGRRMFETWYKMGALLQAGLDLTPIITHRMPANDYAEAFGVLQSGESGKVVMDWTA